jgi:hypothetical protein
MKDQISEELLSAYFDGELSPAERVRVERWLAGNPDSKQIIADYRRMSRMFDGLPRAEVPEEFATEVLQQAERRMLLPEVAALPRRRKIRLLWLAIPTTAAAALMVALNLPGNNPDHGAITRGGAGLGGVPAPSASGNQWKPYEGTPLVGATGKQNGANPSSSAADGLLGTESGNSPDRQPRKIDEPIAVPIVAESESPLTESEQRAVAVMDDAMRGTPDAGGPAEIGKETERLPVISITVDGMEGLALVQRVLEENDIVNMPGASDQRDNAADTDDSPSKGRYALFVVVTDPEPLVRAFVEMFDKRHPGLKIEAQAPIMLADLDQLSRERIGLAVQDVAGISVPSTEPAEKDVPESNPAPAKRTFVRKSAPFSSKVGSSRLTKRLQHFSEATTSAASAPPPADKPEASSATNEADDQAPPAAESKSRQVIVNRPSGGPNPSRATQPDSDQEKSATQGEATGQAGVVVKLLILIDPAPPDGESPPE